MVSSFKERCKQTQNLQTSYIPVFPQDFKHYVVKINYPRTQTHFFVIVVFKNRHSFILTDVWSVISQTAWWMCGWSNMIGDTLQTHDHMMKELCQCPVLRCYQIYQELDFKVRTLTSHPSETPYFFFFNLISIYWEWQNVPISMWKIICFINETFFLFHCRSICSGCYCFPTSQLTHTDKQTTTDRVIFTLFTTYFILRKLLWTEERQ